MVSNFCYEVLRYNCNGLVHVILDFCSFDICIANHFYRSGDCVLFVHIFHKFDVLYQKALETRGTTGNGHVVFSQLSGQNCLIVSYKYHCLSADKPRGATRGGRSS